MSKPIVCIIGRPNVGKSTLFNKIVGKRISIVEDVKGITRDRLYMNAEWLGREFTLIDTGGIESDSDDTFFKHMEKQAMLGMDTADLILFVVDGTEGITKGDQEVGEILMRSGKKVILVCNKVDTPNRLPPDFYDFYSLGLGEPIPVSASHGLGMGDLLDLVVDNLTFDRLEADHEGLRVCIIGKPNVGKSTLVNRLLGDERVIVTDLPGTTRDSVDIALVHEGKNYVITDTAGMRKRGKIDDRIERYSVMRSLNAALKSDVCLLLIDALEGISEQDKRIAGYVHEQGKATLFVINKWDLVQKDTKTIDTWRKEFTSAFSFMSYAPVEFIAAKTGLRVHKLFPIIDSISHQNCRRIPTGLLNDCLNQATAKTQPPTDRGKRLKLYYITQAKTKPPTFVIFVNEPELLHFSYLRYIENEIRRTFTLYGTPVQFIVRLRSKT